MLETSPNYGALHIELLLSCRARETTIFPSFIGRAYRVVIVANCSLVEEICESLDIRSKVDIWLKRFEGNFRFLVILFTLTSQRWKERPRNQRQTYRGLRMITIIVKYFSLPLSFFSRIKLNGINVDVRYQNVLISFQIINQLSNIRLNQSNP